MIKHIIIRLPCIRSATWVLLAILSFVNPSLAFDAGALEYRYSLLKRGVNIHFWVEEKDGQLIHLDAPTNQIGDEDIARLRRMGFTHIRLAISPYPFLQNLTFQEENWRTPTATQFLGEIHRIIKVALAHDMAVVLAVMARDDVKAKLYYEDGYVSQWAAFFWHWGREFAQYDPSRLLFETINEPNNYYFMTKDAWVNPYDPNIRQGFLPRANDLWLAQQEQFVTAIRVHAPNHTIIATADDKSGHDALSMTFPLSDPNVIYGFHYYYPFVFTHQGADWTDMPAPIDSLTYPSYDSNCLMVKEAVGNHQKEAVNWYCKEGWNRQKHEEKLGQLYEWSKRYGVKVWAGEFGAFPNKADKTSVFNYLFDVRSTLESYQFGWSVWEYAGWLGRLEDHNLQKALGVEE